MKKYKQVQDLIAKGDIKQSLEILKERAQEGGDLLNAALMKSGTFEKLQKDSLLGIADPEQAEIAMNRLIAAILSINDAIEEGEEVKSLKVRYRTIIKKEAKSLKTRYRIIILVVSLVLLGIASYFALNLYEQLNNSPIILNGSGTVKNFMISNTPKLLTNPFPRINTLSCPSKIAIKQLIHSNKEDDANYTPIVAMTSFSLDGTQMFQEVGESNPNRKYFALEIEQDELIATIGANDKKSLDYLLNKYIPSAQSTDSI